MLIFRLLFYALLLLILTGCTGKASAPEVVRSVEFSSIPAERNQLQTVATPTPGAMTHSNPEVAHMMEPIYSSNMLPASAERGGQELAWC